MTLFGAPDLLILPLALAIDLVFGEPPNRFHPVVWMGKTIGLLMTAARRQRHSPGAEFLYGLLVTLLVTGLFAAVTWLVLTYVRSLNFAAYILLGAIVLKTAFSLRALRTAAVKVRDLLLLGRLPEARAAVRALVGRDTAQLEDGQVISAAVESVAENSCDSFVAPLFFFVFLGVPGAVAYRAINTLDNTIGFRGRYEYLGKFAARLDDVVNFVPARIAAAILVVAAWVVRQDVDTAWRVMLRDRRKTASPNGGWTMAAMAGALGVRLEKVGHYTLGDAQRPLLPAVIDRSVTMLLSMAFVWTAAVILGKVAWYAAT
jgi:adenosylcobinamide-phosphate synthase